MSKRLTAKEKEEARLAELQAEYGGQISERRGTRYATTTTVTGSNVTESRFALPRRPKPILVEPDAHQSTATEPEVAHSEPPPSEPKKRTQTSEQMQDFRDEEEHMLEWMFDHHTDTSIGSPCGCSDENAIRTTRCYDCCYPPTCSECYIKAHRSSPTHWAEVWDAQQGFFKRHDISTLRPEGYAIHLGHSGSRCPSSSESESGVYFHIVDTNGVHYTRVRFCYCYGNPNRPKQLMQSRYFPATIRRPTMAFTWQVLHLFHLQHLEAKISAYDFIGSLRRLSDNVFAQDTTSNAYPQFRLVIRIWRHLVATKRLGQGHGIDKALPNRQPGNLVVHCPCCLEPGVNMEKGWERTPPHLRHLNQNQFTADGNFHLNKFRKNSDPDDISLFDGKAQFPSNEEYDRYVKNVPVNAQEKNTCENLQVLEKQDRKKFKNMDVSGVVNIQCSHVFVKSTVDLQLGERFANTDAALAHALRQRKVVTGIHDELAFLKSSDLLLSYDISCAYSVHLVERFQEHFPDLVDAVSKIRLLIPLVHVQNHKDNCMYNFSSAYTICACHFHGETAEHVWPESNQLGPQTRQMNKGNRHETIIDHSNDWNWKKTVNIASTLYNDTTEAKALFLTKREAFKALTELYADRAPDWNKADREARIVDSDKEVRCVYRQSQKKVPSQSKIHQMLLDEISDSSKSLKVAKSSGMNIPTFLTEGLRILEDQWRIKRLVASSKSDGSDLLNTDLDKQRDKLRRRIDKWRDSQKSLMPQVADHVERQVVAQSELIDRPEAEVLFLPSDFTTDQHAALELTSHARDQSRLLEGSAYDALHHVRTLVKGMMIVRSDKKREARGQVANTRANAKIREVEFERDLAIAKYNSIRSTMISLGLSPDDPQFRPLELADTERKRTDVRRRVGDSRRTDGPIWTQGGISAGMRAPAAPSGGGAMLSGSMSSATVGTQGSRASRRTAHTVRGGKKGAKRRGAQLQDARDAQKKDRLLGDVALKKKSYTDGWLWKFAPGNLSQKELQDWIEEGDKVQWFRAEAEMQRWQEQWEMKQADFMRCIRWFGEISATWKALADGATPGRAAFAKRTSAMYACMASEAQRLFNRAGYEDRVLDGKILADLVQLDRDDTENQIPHLIRDVDEHSPATEDSQSESSGSESGSLMSVDD